MNWWLQDEDLNGVHVEQRDESKVARQRWVEILSSGHHKGDGEERHEMEGQR
jgi:hypothetical protein